MLGRWICNAARAGLSLEAQPTLASSAEESGPGTAAQCAAGRLNGALRAAAWQERHGRPAASAPLRPTRHRRDAPPACPGMPQRLRRHAGLLATPHICMVPSTGSSCGSAADGRRLRVAGQDEGRWSTHGKGPGRPLPSRIRPSWCMRCRTCYSDAWGQVWCAQRRKRGTLAALGGRRAAAAGAPIRAAISHLRAPDRALPCTSRQSA